MAKMYCVFSREALKKMNGNRGKMSTQAGHAYLHTAVKAREEFPELYSQYMSGRAKKITLVVDTTEELGILEDAYKGKCSTSLVRDAGLTVFSEPTVTCLGLGPLSDELIGEDLKSIGVLI